MAQSTPPTAALSQDVDRWREPYRQMLGFVPPRVDARLSLTGALDPAMVELQERARLHAMAPDCLDAATVQLLVFGMLLMDLNDAASTHALAARRAGATWQQLQAVVNLCYVFRGVSAANRGAEWLSQMVQRESQVGMAAHGVGAST